MAISERLDGREQLFPAALVAQNPSGKEKRQFSDGTRFLNEARATSMVQHPSLVQIYEYGQTEDGIAFLVMEFLDGGTLRQKLEALGGRFTAERAMRLCRQMAAGLQEAHNKGIVHRDRFQKRMFRLQNGANHRQRRRRNHDDSHCPRHGL